MYLSSFRLGNNPERLPQLFGQNRKVAVIANATDGLQPSEARAVKVRQEIDWLTRLSLQPEELDLRHYFGKPKKLKVKITEYGGVWIRGGNTFILRRAAKQSGLDAILLEKKEDMLFVYAGYSAALCLLAPDLHGIELVDDPNFIPEGYDPEIIWGGLTLVKYHIASHFQSPGHPESPLIDKEVAYFIAHQIPFKTLRDGEVIIIE